MHAPGTSHSTRRASSPTGRPGRAALLGKGHRKRFTVSVGAALAVTIGAIVAMPGGNASASGSEAVLGPATYLASRGSSQVDRGSTDQQSTAATSSLRWAPPALSNPITVEVSSSNMNLKLDPSRDYVIKMPPIPVQAEGGMKITGGHNVVLIGGEITHSQWWPAGLASSNRGLFLVGQTGTVHVEGLRISGKLTEGIQLDERLGAIVQLQNIKIDTVVGTQDSNHADLLQTWAGPRQLRVSGFSGSTTYQGMFLTPNQLWSGPAPEFVELHDIDIVGTADSRYLLWMDGNFPVTTSDVWVDPADSRQSNRDQFLWPKGSTIWSSVQVGTPASGPFVTSAEAGAGYVSPGYQ